MKLDRPIFASCPNCDFSKQAPTMKIAQELATKHHRGCKEFKQIEQYRRENNE